MSGSETLNRVRTVLATCAIEGNSYAVATLKHIDGQPDPGARIKAAEGVKAEWDRLTALAGSPQGEEKGR